MQESLIYLSVQRVDDSAAHYPRPDAMTITAAHAALRRRDAEGGLPTILADDIRTVLAVIGRLSVSELVEAFPAARPLQLVKVEP
ncbi:hypothetical protein [Nocardioides sp.]|uniref:hypothetical protein n=1 Tax=Nocardioides sp. TaxID=35761 RepID=UPI0037843FB0